MGSGESGVQMVLALQCAHFSWRGEGGVGSFWQTLAQCHRWQGPRGNRPLSAREGTLKSSSASGTSAAKSAVLSERFYL